ncbi:hypothetical protein GUITHDRAFT_156475 [Guillardia theta CCMP2712]|uniref:Uncharacterized protein n=2 Tax=Guillardia theta TaxID=55529 RepID=L1I6Y8_GUITC|nr:hypothetical protein GUITHDRAFT_156475 [Guillardia theta CCMP2712]EKX31817.1 hypothetical protein GUITHDRAFT_156475 [Guillardia theta CCMP2712]|eukprot:XP_005818797.1 hypothetical protein GUITHDRAFT_156475 [Guillardia theta CCMP2712]
MAAVAPNAEKILKEIEGQITSFHDKSKGSLEAIGLLFSEMASQPLPPQMICQILKMDEETVRASFEAGNPPRASKEQLVEAIRTSIDPEDDVELYRKVLEKHITRFENTEKIMSALSSDLSSFHRHVPVSSSFLCLLPAGRRVRGQDLSFLLGPRACPSERRAHARGNDSRPPPDRTISQDMLGSRLPRLLRAEPGSLRYRH